MAGISSSRMCRSQRLWANPVTSSIFDCASKRSAVSGATPMRRMRTATPSMPSEVLIRSSALDGLGRQNDVVDQRLHGAFLRSEAGYARHLCGTSLTRGRCMVSLFGHRTRLKRHQRPAHRSLWPSARRWRSAITRRSRRSSRPVPIGNPIRLAIRLESVDAHS